MYHIVIIVEHIMTNTCERARNPCFTANQYLAYWRETNSANQRKLIVVILTCGRGAIERSEISVAKAELRTVGDCNIDSPSGGQENLFMAIVKSVIRGCASRAGRRQAGKS